MKTLPSAGRTTRRPTSGRFTSPTARVLSVGALLIGLSLAGTVAVLKAIYKPLWFDEIFTLTISQMRTTGDILEALRLPFDVMPPLYYLICRAALFLVADEHVAIRLPSVCGFLATLAGVYAFLAMRVDRISALAGGAFVACTALADHAYEGRPYA